MDRTPVLILRAWAHHGAVNDLVVRLTSTLDVNATGETVKTCAGRDATLEAVAEWLDQLIEQCCSGG